jgi:hypothetical protein
VSEGSINQYDGQFGKGEGGLSSTLGCTDAGGGGCDGANDGPTLASPPAWWVHPMVGAVKG